MKKVQLFFITFLISFSVFAQKQEKTNQKFLRLIEMLSVENALNRFANEYDLAKGHTYKSVNISNDRTGYEHEKFQQYYKGIKVEYGMAIVHSYQNVAQSVNGELYKVEESSPALNPNIALNKAVHFVNANTYLWESVKQAQLMNYNKPEGELIYYPNLETGIAKLAYKFDIFALSPMSRQIVYVDANSGEILFSNLIIKNSCNHVNEKSTSVENLKTFFDLGTAATRYSGSKQIETTFNGTSYVLRDTTRGNGINTYNCQDTGTYQTVDFTDNDNNWTALEHNNFAKDNGALDAHWGAEKTFDFFSTVFNRNSYDNEGASINSYIHFGNFNNASWNGSAMTYGDGTGGLDIFTALDICAHEIGHAVCSHTADLVYQNESGAMNEGFSDIWGACIEHYGRTGNMNSPYANAVWTIGEDIGSSLRSMSNPNSFGDPDTYAGTYWYTGTADSGGVHTNSSVLNHWFYILTVGETGTNNATTPDTYNVTGIGMAKSSEIAYLAERDYLTANSTFADAREATIEVVNSLYCANSPEAMAVTNAWYAVNVGEQYTTITNDLAVKSLSTNPTLSCSETSFTTTIVLKNQGTNPITSATIQYTVDGGTTSSLNWNGSLLTCDEASIPLTINNLTRGTHTLLVTGILTNDGNSINNSKSINFYINDQGAINVTNTFTNTTDQLITYTDEGSQSWIRSTRTGTMGTGLANTAYMINNTGNYPDQTKTYLVSQCYNLSNLSSPLISFKMKYDLEQDWDIVYVEYSTDFGTNWSVLGEMASGWYNSNRTLASSGGQDCYNCPGAQWTGTNTTNTTYSYPLSSINSATNVIFRIVFHSDEAVNQLGVNVDDFLISGTLYANNFDVTNSISVYPVPSKGIFTISHNEVSLKNVEVYDLAGKIILSKSSLEAQTETTLDLTNAANGVYFVKIETENGKTVKRIIKE